MISDVRPGEVLAGKYQVERLLGRGGMGLVLAARHLHLDERVAIKLMLPDVASNADAVARFVREARASAKIRSEHVVRVSDVGTLDDGQPYMVMEYLDGVDLGALLAARGRLSLEEVAEYLLQACEAISEAHALGIVHRDLKPSNLFLARRVDGSPLVKVLDFGISKVSAKRGEHSDAVTQTSALMGSPLYMSPEQMTSARNVDARSDVWSLGVILYELLSGTPPFSAETLPEVCALILEGRVTPLRERAPWLAPGVDALVQRCLVRDLGGRFADVGELSHALLPFAPARARVSIERISAALGVHGQRFDATAPAASVPAEQAITPPSTNRATHAAWAESNPFGRKRTSRALVAGVFALALAGGSALVLLGRAKQEPNVASAVAPPERAPSSMNVTPVVTATPEPAPLAVVPVTTASIVAAPSVAPAATAMPATTTETRAVAAQRTTPHRALPKVGTKPAPPPTPAPAVTAPAAAAPPADPAPKAATAAPNSTKPKAPVTMGGRL